MAVKKTLRHWFSDRICSISILTTGDNPAFNEIFHIAIIPLDMNYKPDGPACTAFIKPMDEDVIDFRKGSHEKKMITTALEQGISVDRFIDYFDNWYDQLERPYKKDGLSRGKLIPLGYKLYELYPFLYQLFSKSYTEQVFTLDRGIDLNVVRNCFDDLYAESGQKGEWINSFTFQRLLNKANIFAYSEPNALSGADNAACIYRYLLQEMNRWTRY